MRRRDVAVTSDWLAAGTAHFLAQVAALDDAALAGPSRLPAWSNAHVVAHVARNAEALGRLLSWARTGVPSPMYASPEQRNADIARAAGRRPAEIRADVQATAAALADAVADFPVDSWSAEVRTAQGRVIPAAEVPWMRVVEVWMHAADLGGTGTSVADLPADVAAELLGVVATSVGGREGVPPLRVRDTDTGTVLALGDGVAPTAVEGTTHALLAWFAGRPPGAAGVVCSGPVPPLPAWL